MRAKSINEKLSVNNNPQKLYENMQQAKAILKKHGLTKENETFQKLRELLGNNLGAIGKLTKWIFDDGHSFENVKDAYELWDENRNLGINLQSKDIKKPEDIHDLVAQKSSSKRAKQFIDKIPKRLRSKLVDDDIINMLERNVDDNIKRPLIKWLEKLNRYLDDPDNRRFKEDLRGKINQLKNHSAQGIKNKIKTNNLEDEATIVAEKEDELLVVKIDSYKASSILGTKDWCISTSESTYNEIVDLISNQFFIYDFRKDPAETNEYMLGVTIGPNGKVTHAHWADDKEAKKEDAERILSELD